MTDKSCFPAGIVHDRVAGRVRLRHAGLVGRPDLVREVEAALRGTPGVDTVRASALTGSVLVTFRPSTGNEELARLTGAVIARGGHAPGGVASAALDCEGAAATGCAETPQPVNGCWHALPAVRVASLLGSSPGQGLPPGEAARRLAAYGRNELPRQEERSVFAIFAGQFASLPVVLLGVSAGLSLATGGLADAVVIAAVAVLNAAIATATERQAERTILGLSRYEPHPVPVIREGRRASIHPAEVVPGDLLLLERGLLVPADARLVMAHGLMVNEAVLTGEALPAAKDAGAVLPLETALPDQHNMVFCGTAVADGSGAALVTATGRAAVTGRVQELLGSLRPPETPIERQLGDVGRDLVIVNGLICAAVFALGILHGRGLVPMLRSAVSLLVAAIPEGLPAVATTTLAIGVEDMRRHHVLVRKLDAVETLGAVNVIGLDKTGTLTGNQMAAVAVHTGGAMLTLDKGQLAGAGGAAADTLRAMARRLFEVAALCSDATVRMDAAELVIEGSATEGALVKAAYSLGADVVALRASLRLLARLPRGPDRMRMSILYGRGEEGRLLCVKGDPAEVLVRCTAWVTASGVQPLDAGTRAEIARANSHMAGQGLRVLGFALREDGGDPHDERNLVWLGLAGLANPIRPCVMPALRQLHRAGIRTIMVTGDQSATATAIARKLGLHGSGGELRVLEAGRIAGLSPDVLAALATQPHVFARASPIDKLNIVRALQKAGQIVAMTGDGINDGPALRAANIGIAMGAEGSDTAREVASIVLARDDLDGIVAAVRLGRTTYANIRKVLRYLVSTNASETAVMLGVAVLNGGEPLTPMQLLWLNLVSDPLPALALGLDPPEADVLEQPPYDASAPILGAGDFRQIVREGAVIGGGALAAYFLAGGRSGGTAGRTLTFHGLTGAQLLHAVASRSRNEGFAAEFFRRPNPNLYAALAVSAGLQVLAQALPFLRRLLGLAPLGPGGLLKAAGLAAGCTLANDVLGRVFQGKPAAVTARPVPQEGAHS